MFDLLFGFVMMTSIAVVIFFVIFVFQQINSAGLFEQSTTSNEIGDNFDTWGIAMFNNVFLAIVMAIVIGALVLAFNLRTHPMFFPVGMLILLIGVVLAVVFSNAYQEASDGAEFSQTRERLFFLDNIMDHLPIYLMGFGILMLAVLYGLGRAGEILG
jgi:hypothetical protein